jgi:hypothetical protein
MAHFGQVLKHYPSTKPDLNEPPLSQGLTEILAYRKKDLRCDSLPLRKSTLLKSSCFQLDFTLRKLRICSQHQPAIASLSKTLLEMLMKAFSSLPLVLAILGCGGGSSYDTALHKPTVDGATVKPATVYRSYKLSSFSRANCINNESISWDRDGEDWRFLVISYQISDLGDMYTVQCLEYGAFRCGAVRWLGAMAPGVWYVWGEHNITHQDPIKYAFLKEYCDSGWYGSGEVYVDQCKETYAEDCNASEF